MKLIGINVISIVELICCMLVNYAGTKQKPNAKRGILISKCF